MLSGWLDRLHSKWASLDDSGSGSRAAPTRTEVDLAEYKDEETAPSVDNTAADADLLDAAWAGDVERATAALAVGARLECYSQDGNTPLHMAVEHLNLNVVRILLDAGADVNGRTANGFWTPMAHAADIVSDAASQRQVAPDNDLIRLLVEHGADVNAPLSDGDTPLDVLAHYLNHEAVEILTAAGGVRRADR